MFLENHGDCGVIAKFLIQSVQLFTRCGDDGTRYTQVTVFLAGAHFYRRFIQIGRVFTNDADDCLHQMRFASPHDLDGKVEWISYFADLVHRVCFNEFILPRLSH